MKLTEDFLAKELTLFCLFVLFVCFFRSCCISVKHPFKRTECENKNTSSTPSLSWSSLPFPRQNKTKQKQKNSVFNSCPWKKNAVYTEGRHTTILQVNIEVNISYWFFSLPQRTHSPSGKRNASSLPWMADPEQLESVVLEKSLSSLDEAPGLRWLYLAWYSALKNKEGAVLRPRPEGSGVHELHGSF